MMKNQPKKLIQVKIQEKPPTESLNRRQERFFSFCYMEKIFFWGFFTLNV